MTAADEKWARDEARRHAQAIVDQTPALLKMIEGKIYEIDHPWRTRWKKLWAAIKGQR